MVANAFREKKDLEVYEEDPCTAVDDSLRPVDINVMDRGKEQAGDVDPTVRYEGGEHRAADVNEEKKRHLRS
ncbi:hypothetical protein RvY_12602 [Ramazzottius varieornatus]|uniref:Uncharacterized protein n=1 Tax=Ramazzottius varieornatus TaxID=947166 RepID=A0A1D1VK43_RAMVA|nr:hypothetical protein RvY_12602 [Ramazzottius varieornatus]